MWGVSTAGFQVEGAATNPNSTWARWEADGHVRGGARSGDACGWWQDPTIDLDRAADLGVTAMRVGIEWSRIEPRPGVLDLESLARYRTLLEGCRSRGISPVVCLHHFSEPVWFADRGGFATKDAPLLFARHAERLVKRYGDLVDWWLTINEPNVYAAGGWVLGAFPPGRTGDIRAVARQIGGLVRAHGAAYRAIKAVQPQGQVGWAHHLATFDPATSGRRDRLAAATLDRLFNGAFLDSVLDGSVPRVFTPWAGDVSGGVGTYDFLGFNTYGRMLVAFDPRLPGELFARRSVAEGAMLGDGDSADSHGEVYPQGIDRHARRLAGHGVPVYVLENGVPDSTDRLRPWVVGEAAVVLHRLIADGVDVRGYFHWSLVDNWEWERGWEQRFGLYALDVSTGERTLRPSGALFKHLATAPRSPATRT